MITWFVVVLLVALAIWVVRKSVASHRGKQLGNIAGGADRTGDDADARPDTEALREGMHKALKSIRTSRIGLLKGNAALYELPWYAIIGNPAAGKSSAILNSGLKFPFEDNRAKVIQGIGGTRNCEWFFTTEGIVLDTAGRYSVSKEDRDEWLHFLDLLKKHRRRAPINGVIIAASISELSGDKPEFAIELAKSLRQRMQEVTERLEVFAPVYVIFTKADLIAGFNEFFRDLDPDEREQVWGATLPYDPVAGNDALSAFDVYFDELSEGLKEVSLSQLAMRRGRDVSPALLTLPLEFASIKPMLRTFIATLFEDNPYQFQPIFRGFYFTSAMHEGESVHHASERVGNEFGLRARTDTSGSERESYTAHFLTNLFRKVIFADKNLVRQYSSPNQRRLRHTGLVASAAVLAIVLAWWTWSYRANQVVISNAAAALEQAVQAQDQRVDLHSRIDALLILQHQIEQVTQHRRRHRLASRLGLSQGRRIEEKLLWEYFHGMRQVMLEPTSTRMESFLSEVAAGTNQADSNGALRASREGATIRTQYQPPSPDDTDDAYNALKAYLMLSNRSRVEQIHLAHQLARFWHGWLEANRGQMTREDIGRVADQLTSFYTAHSDHPSWPQIQPRVTLIGDARQVLTERIKGQTEIERVYANIKARAASRFPTITVNSLIGETHNQDTIVGDYAVLGTFSRQAWDEYVEDAINEAATTELSTDDWVLDTVTHSDLSRRSRPEDIAQELVAMYKREYAQEWLQFLRGIRIASFTTFRQALERMSIIGDPGHSPLRTFIEAVNEQTIWDNPAAAAHAQGQHKRGFRAWFSRVILRRSPPRPEAGERAQGERWTAGPVGAAFAGFPRLVAKLDDNPTLVDNYLERLARLRTRLNAIELENTPGPGAYRLMRDTMNGDSELSAAQALIEEEMLRGLEADQRDLLQPLLMGPLVETFAALIEPTEDEINKIWMAQVYEPFRASIAQQFPFNPSSDVDAAGSDIAAIFGSRGAIAAFNQQSLGPLVIQRGNLLESRRWLGLGITLSRQLVSNFDRWVSDTPENVGGGADAHVFQVLPSPASGAVEYTLDIYGKSMRYRNTPPQWETFQWPNPGGQPGARLSAVTPDGRTVHLVNEQGEHSMARLLDAATIQQRQDGSTITWGRDGISITVDMRMVQRPGARSGTQGDWRRGLQLPSRITDATQAREGVASPQPQRQN